MAAAEVVDMGEEVADVAEAAVVDSQARTPRQWEEDAVGRSLISCLAFDKVFRRSLALSRASQLRFKPSRRSANGITRSALRSNASRFLMVNMHLLTGNMYLWLNHRVQILLAPMLFKAYSW